MRVLLFNIEIPGTFGLDVPVATWTESCGGCQFTLANFYTNLKKNVSSQEKLSVFTL